MDDQLNFRCNTHVFEARIGNRPMGLVAGSTNDGTAVGIGTQSSTVPEVIWFRLPSSAAGDGDLNRAYTKAQDRAVATMIRDLMAVTTHHMRSLSEDDVFPVSAITAPAFCITEGRDVPSRGLCEVVEKLQALQMIFNSTLDPESAPPVPVSFAPGYSGVDYKPQPGWPLNREESFLSKLCSRYSCCVSNLEPQQLEIADYCIAVHDKLEPEEPIFQTEGGGPVLRRHIMSLDHNADVDPIVVQAWERICIHTFKQYGRFYRTCLSTVSKEGIDTSGFPGPEQLDLWMTWIEHNGIDLSKAELIFIPLLKDRHYTLLFVNFRTRLIQCIDTRYDVTRVDRDEFVHSTLAIFWMLLQRLGDGRFNSSPEFTYEVVHPCWSTTTHDPESGLTTMRLIDIMGEPSGHLEMLRLQEEHVRVETRIAICSLLAMSHLNVLRGSVVKKVHDFIYQKNDCSIQPSRAMINYRNKYNSKISGTAQH